MPKTGTFVVMSRPHGLSWLQGQCLNIEPDNKPLEETISLAAKLVTSLPAFDAAAKPCGEDLLEPTTPAGTEYDQQERLECLRQFGTRNYC